MKPDKVERLTLSLFMFRAWIKEEIKRGDMEARLEAAELEEERDDTVDDAPALDEAIAHDRESSMLNETVRGSETLPPLFTGVAAACFGSSIIFLLITSFTDPGILPRNPDPQVLRQPQPPMYRNRTDEYGNVQTDTWCTTCHIYRPPRATHCQDCDNCVRDFDHHCPFTRNCIGARNYGFFICFLSSLSLSLAVLLCGCMLLGTVAENHGTVLGKPLKEPLEGNRRLINFSLVAFSTFMGMMIWGFTAYHLTLVIGGMTTKEHIKGRKHGAKRLTVMDRCCAIQPSELEPYKLVPDPYDRPPPRVVPVVGYEQL